MTNEFEYFAFVIGMVHPSVLGAFGKFAHELQRYFVFRAGMRPDRTQYLPTLNRRKPNHRMAAQARRKMSQTGRKDAARRGQQCTIA